MKKKIENIILGAVVSLVIWGIIMVLSTTINAPGYGALYIKQMIAFFIGLLIMLFMRNFSYEILEEISPLLYIFSIVLLTGVLFFGSEINGSRRWFYLGFFYFQPVEFTKFSVILFLASVLRKYNRLFYSIVPVFIVMALVMLQPDAGSAFVFLPVLIMTQLVSRANTRWMVMVLPFALLAVFTIFLESYFSVKSTSVLTLKFILYPVIISFIICFIFMEIKTVKKHLNVNNLILLLVLFWVSIGIGIGGANMLKGYQKKRIVSFMIPELDPLGIGYNIRQSVTAVGSGKILGKGLFRGTQTQLGFLPVKHTDFILASVAEELGFVGAVCMIMIYGLLLWQIIRIMERAEDPGGRLIASGIFALILAQVVLNLGVTLGMFPVIGIQLPLVSYGGTGMVVFMALIGILLNINKRTEMIGK